MKALFCVECGDLFALSMHREKSCECGRARGRYVNREQATFSGGLPIGIANGDLRSAAARWPGKVTAMRCWVDGSSSSWTEER